MSIDGMPVAPVPSGIDRGLATRRPRLGWTPGAAGILLAVMLVLDIASMQRMTLTADEDATFRYGRQILELDARRFDDSKMPFSALNAVPAKAAGLLGPGRLRRRLEKPETGRYVTVLLSLALGLLVFRWAGRLYGPSGALLALALYTFDPNILAHSRLVTADLPATCLITLALYAFWRYLSEGSWRWATAAALVLGLSQVAKYTSVLLYPIFALIALGRFAPELRALAARSRARDLARRGLVALSIALLFVVVSLAVVNVGFLFDRTLRPLGAYWFRSAVFARLAAALPGLRAPVPYPYLQGIDWGIANARQGVNVYLLGQLGRGGRPGEPFPEYYLVGWLFKVPLATQALVLAAAGACLGRWRRLELRRNEWTLLCPVLVYAVFFSFFNRLQIGLRHLLMVFPLLHVFAGSLVQEATPPRRTARWVIVGLVLYAAASVMSYYPHFLAYFNELVWDRKQAYRILADSNLDWGQSGWYLEQWLKRHPDAVVEPDSPEAGTIVVGVNWLTGVTGPDKYRWLREHFEPVGQVAYSYLVFKVTPEDLERIRLR